MYILCIAYLDCLLFSIELIDNVEDVESGVQKCVIYI